jgi:hypothetical protein
MAERFTWWLTERDRSVVAALKHAGDIQDTYRPITVRFTGASVHSDSFQLEMVMTGWEICQLATDSSGALTIVLECTSTTRPDALERLSERIRKIASSHGIEYNGWAIDPADG